MFRGATNPYDEPVAKTTDENLTGENWELILNLCDKVSDEGETGAREVIAALVKRLTHRNPNVQLYSLSLAEALSKNCGLEINREIASRAFTASLERLITDRTTHDKVKKRTLAMIQQWASEFENDPTLGIMEECYQGLKAKNYKFDSLVEPPPEVDDSIKKKEEEELQRVLELSLVDKGGRNQWYSGGYVAGGGAAASSANAGASGSRNASTANLHSHPAAGSSSSAAPPATSSSSKPAASKAPATTAPSYASVAPSKKQSLEQPAASTPVTAPTVASTAATASPKGGSSNLVTRVRALHSFEPTELGELAFEKGDIIKVVDRGYKDWWRGQLKGKTGIFPVNYVEPLPEPTQAEIAREMQMEMDVFTQAPSIDKLLTMLRGLDPLKDNLADNDELQELYRQSMSLRPKIVKLIDKYTQKRIELSSMNDNFKTARQMFEAMMEESLAKHSPGVMYDYRQPGPPQGYDYGQQGYGGWNQGAYNGQPQGPPPPSQPPYPGYPQSGPPQGPYPTGGSQDYVQPYGPAPPIDPQSAYAQQYGPQYAQQPPPAPYQLGPEQQQQQQQQGQPQGPPQQYGGQGYPQYPQQNQQPGQAPAPQQQPQQPPQQQQQQQQQPSQQQQPTPQQGGPPAYGQAPAQGGSAPSASGYQQGGPESGYGAAAAAAAAAAGAAALRPVASQHPSSAQLTPQPRGSSMDSAPAKQASQQAAQQQQQPQPPQNQPQPAPQPVSHPQTQPVETRPLSQATLDQQQQQPASSQEQLGQGPPYVWSATAQYPDPGAQAWAQYYAMGGTDPAGRVYFTPESLPPEGSIQSPQGEPGAEQGEGSSSAQATLA